MSCVWLIFYHSIIISDHAFAFCFRRKCNPCVLFHLTHVCLSTRVLSWFIIWAASWQNQQSECAPSEDSDQPGHPPSLIIVFPVRMKKHWVLSYPLSAQRRLWSDWRMPRLIWVFAGRTAILLVLSCRGSYRDIQIWICKLNLHNFRCRFSTILPLLLLFRNRWCVTEESPIFHPVGTS